MADGFGTNDIITGRGLGIGGFGFPYGGYGGYGMTCSGFANPSANAVRINASDSRMADQNMCTRELLSSDVEDARNALDALARQNADSITRAEMNTGFDRINDTNLQNVILNGQSALSNERRQSDLFMNLNNQINDFRSETAKCCCDLKVEGLENTQKVLSKIDARALEDTQRDLDRCLQEKQTQTILAAMPNGNTCL